MGTSNGTVQPVGLVGLGLMGRGRVLLAGTYNGHPVPLAAAIATIYTRLEALGRRFENGFRSIAAGAMHLVRQGSAFCIYFMDHAPVDWHDIAMNHDFAADARMRRALIEKGLRLPGGHQAMVDLRRSYRGDDRRDAGPGR